MQLSDSAVIVYSDDTAALLCRAVFFMVCEITGKGCVYRNWEALQALFVTRRFGKHAILWVHFGLRLFGKHLQGFSSSMGLCVL